jgi:hypothetical protein
MRRLATACLTTLVVVAMAGVAQAGGRARVTRVEAPGEVRAGRTFDLAFTLRPEMFVRNRRLAPRVKATCGDLEVIAAALPLKARDRFAASLTLPHAGVWQILVDSGYCETVMDPLVVTAWPPGGRSS